MQNIVRSVCEFDKKGNASNQSFIVALNRGDVLHAYSLPKGIDQADG
jgi:hypothetical protein